MNSSKIDGLIIGHLDWENVNWACSGFFSCLFIFCVLSQCIVLCILKCKDRYASFSSFIFPTMRDGTIFKIPMVLSLTSVLFVARPNQIVPIPNVRWKIAFFHIYFIRKHETTKCSQGCTIQCWFTFLSFFVVTFLFPIAFLFINNNHAFTCLLVCSNLML